MNSPDDLCIFDCPVLLALTWAAIALLAVPSALALFSVWDEWFGR